MLGTASCTFSSVSCSVFIVSTSADNSYFYYLWIVVPVWADRYQRRLCFCFIAHHEFEVLTECFFLYCCHVSNDTQFLILFNGSWTLSKFLGMMCVGAIFFLHHCRFPSHFLCYCVLTRGQVPANFILLCLCIEFWWFFIIIDRSYVDVVTPWWSIAGIVLQKWYLNFNAVGLL